MCIFKLVNLIIITYLTIYQIENIIKLNKKIDNPSQNGQLVLVKWDMTQVQQNKMTCLIKMTNDF
jgi:competence protein ComGC